MLHHEIKHVCGLRLRRRVSLLPAECSVIGELRTDPGDHRAGALGSNLSEIPTRCRLQKFALVVNVLDVLGDVRSRGVE